MNDSIKICSPNNSVYGKENIKPYAEPLTIFFYFKNQIARTRHLKKFLQESLGGNKMIAFRASDVKTIIHGSYELPDVMSFYFFANAREMRNFLIKTKFNDIIIVPIKDIHLRLMEINC